MISLGILADELSVALRIAQEIEHGIDRWARPSDPWAEDVRHAAAFVVRSFDDSLAAARSLQHTREAIASDGFTVLVEMLLVTQSAVVTLDRELADRWGRMQQNSDRMRLRRLLEVATSATTKFGNIFLDETLPPGAIPPVEADVQEEPQKTKRSETSRRLTDWAARMLPAADRREYTELFHAELYDLANSGCGRRAQIAYALRVLVRAPWLRRELSAPMRERSW